MSAAPFGISSYLNSVGASCWLFGFRQGQICRVPLVHRAGDWKSNPRRIDLGGDGLRVLSRAVASPAGDVLEADRAPVGDRGRVRAVPVTGATGGRERLRRWRWLWRSFNPSQRRHERRVMLAATMLHESLTFARVARHVVPLARRAGAACVVAAVRAIPEQLHALVPRFRRKPNQRIRS